MSAQDRDNARTTYEASQAAVRAQEAQVEVARVQIATTESQVHLAETQVAQQRAGQRMAQMRLDDTRVVAPFSGYVAEKRLEVGASVSAQAAATSNASIAILMLQDIDPVKVQVEVPERDVPRVRPGNAVRVTSDAYPGRRFSGRVARVVHALDPRTRTMGIEVDIPNPEHLLKPGMYARVELVVEVRPGRAPAPAARCSPAPKAGRPSWSCATARWSSTVVELGAHRRPAGPGRQGTRAATPR